MSDQNYIEVELRGSLTKDQAVELTRKLENIGTFIKKSDRIFIDYSVFIAGEGIRERERDVRIRVTNGESEIIVKTGVAGSYEDRREYSVKSKGSFDELAQTMAVLGYSKGICGRRLGTIYVYKDCEFVIYEVPNHSYYFEVDVMTTVEGRIKSLTLLKSLCREFELETFTNEDLYEYMERLNKESNFVYDADSMDDDYFANTYGV